MLLLASLMLVLGAFAQDVGAATKLPVVTRIDPAKIAIGKTLTISGRNIVKGRNKMRVIFQRSGSKRRFSARGRGVTTKKMTVTVPDVSADMPTLLPTVFRIRLISKFGLAKNWTNPSRSPEIFITGSAAGAAADCDLDGVPNTVDTDDDNDLLPDVTEAAIGTDPCNPDTDGDGVSDYYEYRVATEFNGGPVLPYPGRTPYPNPLVSDSSTDFDGDGLTMLEEYSAWQYTGRMDRFYSDANQNSINPTTSDGMLDEDGDLLPNIVELKLFGGTYPLDWLNPDTDGDGLCDGLDDQDHDGPATPLTTADCGRRVPNNSPAGYTGSDSWPTLTDGDDNRYSNWYEWYYETAWYDPCDPSPSSGYCPIPFP